MLSNLRKILVTGGSNHAYFDLGILFSLPQDKNKFLKEYEDCKRRLRETEDKLNGSEVRVG